MWLKCALLVIIFIGYGPDSERDTFLDSGLISPKACVIHLKAFLSVISLPQCFDFLVLMWSTPDHSRIACIQNYVQMSIVYLCVCKQKTNQYFQMNEQRSYLIHFAERDIVCKLVSLKGRYLWKEGIFERKKDALIMMSINADCDEPDRPFSSHFAASLWSRKIYKLGMRMKYSVVTWESYRTAVKMPL